MAGNQREHDQRDSACERPELGKIELAQAHPELGVNRFGDDEVEGALAHVLGNLQHRESEEVIEGTDDVESCAEDLGVGTVPAGNGLDFRIDHEQDNEKETEPCQVLEHLGDEVGTELELAGKRAFEKRAVNPPVVTHRFEAYFESWSF